MQDMIFDYKKYYSEKSILAPTFYQLDNSSFTELYLVNRQDLSDIDYIINKVCKVNIQVLGVRGGLFTKGISILISPLIDYFFEENYINSNDIIHDSFIVGHSIVTFPIHTTLMKLSCLVSGVDNSIEFNDSEL